MYLEAAQASHESAVVDQMHVPRCILQCMDRSSTQQADHTDHSTPSAGFGLPKGAPSISNDTLACESAGFGVLNPLIIVYAGQHYSSIPVCSLSGQAAQAPICQVHLEHWQLHEGLAANVQSIAPCC